MKKLCISLLAVAVVVMLTPALATAGVVQSEHDFTKDFTDTITEGGQVCIFCHAPHNAPGASDGPLWNRGLSTTGYTMYDPIYSDQPSEPGVASARCMSCHDGVTNVDAFGGGGGTLAIGSVKGWDTVNNADANLGKNLTDTHPISINYDSAQTAGASLESTKPTTLQFYTVGGDRGGSYVECSSCHDPHNTTIDPFLRLSNAASALCDACHTN